jgi:hypothetical protein
VQDALEKQPGADGARRNANRQQPNQRAQPAAEQMDDD